MIFTEKEAAAKRCTPMQIIWLMPDRDERGAAMATGAAELNCIGSRCAQWRWYDTPNGDGVSSFPKKSGAYSIKGAAGKAPSGFSNSQWVNAPARGFCGMAGRVE